MLPKPTPAGKRPPGPAARSTRGVRGGTALARALQRTRAGDVTPGNQLGSFVDFNQSDAGGVVRAADLKSVGAGAEAQQERAVGAALGERERGDALRGGADVGGVGVGVPAGVGAEGLAAG